MKKFVCLLLVLAMAAVPLVACSGGGETETKGPTGGTQNPANTGGEEKDVLDIPAGTDLGGEEFEFLTEQLEDWGYYPLDFDEPDSDDPYANAIYNRNTAVEELLHCTLTGSTPGDGGAVRKAFQTDVDASSGDYDFSFMPVNEALTVTGNGQALPFDQLTYVDLNKSWWDASCTEQTALVGRNYFAAGDIMIGDKDVLWGIYFIKNQLNAIRASDKYKDLEHPYDAVTNGTWTWDLMMKYAAAGAQDNDGTDVIEFSSPSDVFGFATHHEDFPASWQSAGLKMAEIDDDGAPYATWGTEEFFNVYADIQNLFNQPYTYWTQTPTELTDLFQKNRSLFITEVLSFVRKYRSNEEQFGILPYPKYNESIDHYNTYVAVNSAVLVVPTTLENANDTSIVLETMAAKGSELIMETYINEQLGYRYVHDEESRESVMIILSDRCYDMGVFMNLGYDQLKASLKVNPSAQYAALKKNLGKTINDYLGKLLDS